QQRVHHQRKEQLAVVERRRSRLCRRRAGAGGGSTDRRARIAPGGGLQERLGGGVQSWEVRRGGPVGCSAAEGAPGDEVALDAEERRVPAGGLAQRARAF